MIIMRVYFILQLKGENCSYWAVVLLICKGVIYAAEAYQPHDVNLTEFMIVLKSELADIVVEEAFGKSWEASFFFLQVTCLLYKG